MKKVASFTFIKFRLALTSSFCSMEDVSSNFPDDRNRVAMRYTVSGSMLNLQLSTKLNEAGLSSAECRVNRKVG